MKPLPLPATPDVPVNVQAEPVGLYWNASYVPVPTLGVSNPASATAMVCSAMMRRKKMLAGSVPCGWAQNARKLFPAAASPS